MHHRLVAALVVAALVAVRVALRGVSLESMPWPPALPDDRVTGDPITLITVPDEPWTLFLGGSSIYYGLDSDALGVPHRKQTIPRARATDEFALWHWDRIVLPPEKLPRRVVVTYNQSSLVDRNEFDARTPCQSQLLVERLDDRAFASLGCETEGDPWLAATRTERWFAARGMAMRAAGWWFGRMLGAPAPAPGPDLHKWKIEGRNERHTKERLAMWNRLGVMGRLPAAVHDRALELLYAEAAASGVPVVALLMPELSHKRELYTPESVGAFLSLAQRHSDVVLDLRDAVPDEGFFDDSHTNSGGRRTLTARLATELAGLDVTPP